MKKWTQEEEQFIIDNYFCLTQKQIAEKLKRSLESIEHKVNDFLFDKISNQDHLKHKKLISNLLSVLNESKTNENNPNWRGGVSKNYYHYKKLQIERYPEKVEARKIVQKAIKCGKLIRQPCEICSTIERVEAHHDDYTKPLKVRWMCKKHHLEYHRKRGEIK